MTRYYLDFTPGEMTKIESVVKAVCGGLPVRPGSVIETYVKIMLDRRPNLHKEVADAAQLSYYEMFLGGKILPPLCNCSRCASARIYYGPAQD